MKAKTWEDTVMSGQAQYEIRSKAPIGEWQEDIMMRVARNQAEITWDIAFNEGVKKTTIACDSTFSEMLKEERAKRDKEWVEWLIGKHSPLLSDAKMIALTISVEEWQDLKRSIDEH